MGALSPTHWLMALGVLVLLFGAKRLPDAARSLGRSARILKAEVKEMNPDSTDNSNSGPAVPSAALPQTGPAPVPVADVAQVSSARMATVSHASGEGPRNR